MVVPVAAGTDSAAVFVDIVVIEVAVVVAAETYFAVVAVVFA